MDFYADILPLILETLLVPLAALVGWALKSLVSYLSSKSEEADATALERLGLSVGARVATEVDHAIDYAASQTRGRFEKARLPESPGGTSVVGEEWDEIRTGIASEVRSGLGDTWTARLMRVTGLASSDAVTSYLTKAVESRFRSRAISADLMRNPLEPEEVEDTLVPLAPGSTSAEPAS